MSKHSSQTIKKHTNMVDDEPVIEEIDTGEMEEEEEEQAQPVQPESVRIQNHEWKDRKKEKKRRPY